MEKKLLDNAETAHVEEPVEVSRPSIGPSTPLNSFFQAVDIVPHWYRVCDRPLHSRITILLY